MSHPLFILSFLALAVALSEWLVRHTPLRHLGSALLVIVLSAIAANAGLIPTFSPEIPIYQGVFEYLAPLAIFLLLLQVNLHGIVKAGLPMVLLFLLGALGTMAGVWLGMWVVGGSAAFGDLYFALGGMFVGTYTGGSINFNAIALEYGVAQDGLLYAGAAAVDSAMTTVWMAVTVALPRALARMRSGRRGVSQSSQAQSRGSEAPGAEDDRETVHPLDLALLVGMGGAVVWIAELSRLEVPSILIVTTLALLLAQLRPIQGLRGARLSGWLAVMLFLAVIGALCDFSALQQIGQLGRSLMLFVVVLVLVHGVIVFGVSALFRADTEMAAVASQANIGGSTSALALARSLRRHDLVLPAILIGSLGNALGTYLGFLTVIWLR